MHLQQVKSSPKEGGGCEETYWVSKSILAEIKPLRAKELIVAMGSQIQISHKIKIRFDPVVKPCMRLLYKGRIFVIQTVINENEEDRFNILYCLEISYP